ncbi:MAG TPA: CopG family transcriptional regulator [Thermoanaerobaculia bacterium]|nr:CopG family transcriptional regulator [Thermoanaerobaculia bacterium]
MSQLTLYLDPETEKLLKAAAKASGLSVSRWVCDLVRERVTADGPQRLARLAGAWKDAPTAEDFRAAEGQDVLREPF